MGIYIGSSEQNRKYWSAITIKMLWNKLPQYTVLIKTCIYFSCLEFYGSAGLLCSNLGSYWVYLQVKDWIKQFHMFLILLWLVVTWDMFLSWVMAGIQELSQIKQIQFSLPVETHPQNFTGQPSYTGKSYFIRAEMFTQSTMRWSWKITWQRL